MLTHNSNNISFFTAVDENTRVCAWIALRLITETDEEALDNTICQNIAMTEKRALFVGELPEGANEEEVRMRLNDGGYA